MLLAMVLVYSENVKELCLKNDEFMIFRHNLRFFVIKCLKYFVYHKQHHPYHDVL